MPQEYPSCRTGEAPKGVPPPVLLGSTISKSLADGQIIELLLNVIPILGGIGEVIVAHIALIQGSQALGGQVAADGAALPVSILGLLALQTGDEIDEQLAFSGLGQFLIRATPSGTAEFFSG